MTTPDLRLARTLHPGLSGKDVGGVQLLLQHWSAVNHNHVRGYGVSPDPAHGVGFFGDPMTLQVKKFQAAHTLNHPRDPIPASGWVGERTLAALASWSTPPAEHLLAAAYADLTAPDERTVICTAMRAAYAHRGWMIYSGPNHATVWRRWDGIQHHVLPPNAPRFGDCSSIAIWAVWLAHIDGGHVIDPTGNGYRWGTTETMKRYGRILRASQALPGTSILYSSRGTLDETTHTATVVQIIGGVPYCIGFGHQGGPQFHRYDAIGLPVVGVRDYVM